jgi:hypothetical protein
MDLPPVTSPSNILDVSATPTPSGIKRECYVCMYVLINKHHITAILLLLNVPTHYGAAKKQKSAEMTRLNFNKRQVASKMQCKQSVGFLRYGGTLVHLCVPPLDCSQFRFWNNSEVSPALLAYPSSALRKWMEKSRMFLGISPIITLGAELRSWRIWVSVLTTYLI